ncbi:MAG TPA: cytosolic protein [Virgibacillus sp.]|nr:cytosolic protein [Virgibacillus sp.]
MKYIFTEKMYGNYFNGVDGMSFRQKLAKYFNNHAETRDNHLDSTLETRYFKTTKDKAMLTLESFFKNAQGYRLNAQSNEHGEISVLKQKGKKCFIVVTVIMVRPFNTAIDFSVTTESFMPFDFGYSTRLINKFYSDIQKEIPIVEKSS